MKCQLERNIKAISGKILPQCTICPRFYPNVSVQFREISQLSYQKLTVDWTKRSYQRHLLSLFRTLSKCFLIKSSQLLMFGQNWRFLRVLTLFTLFALSRFQRHVEWCSSSSKWPWHSLMQRKLEILGKPLSLIRSYFA